MKYDSSKHIELLQWRHNLETQNKSLFEVDRKKFMLLMQYLPCIADWSYWLEKNNDINLMNDFVNFKIDGKKFLNEYKIIYNKCNDFCIYLEKDFERLKTLDIDEVSYGFSDFILEINYVCDAFYDETGIKPGDLDQSPTILDETSFREVVSEILFNIQKF